MREGHFLSGRFDFGQAITNREEHDFNRVRRDPKNSRLRPLGIPLPADNPAAAMLSFLPASHQVNGK
jgi:hypothetical protein